MQSIFSLRADRETWFNFVCEVKKEKKNVWQVLEPMIKTYMKKRK